MVLAEGLALRLPGLPDICGGVVARVVEGDDSSEEGMHRWGAGGGGEGAFRAACSCLWWGWPGVCVAGHLAAVVVAVQGAGCMVVRS